MPKTLPLKEALLNAMSIAESSVEAAQYLATRFKEILIEAKKLDKYRDILTKVENFAQSVSLKLLSSVQPWKGEAAPSSTFQNEQLNKTKEAISNLKSTAIGEVTVHFAINENSQFVRGYTSGNKPVDPKSAAELDKLFTSWLAGNNLVMEGGALFQASSLGKSKRMKKAKRLEQIQRTLKV